MIRTTTSVKPYAATAFITVVVSLATAAVLAQGLPVPTASARAALKQLSLDDVADPESRSEISGIYTTPHGDGVVGFRFDSLYLFSDGTYVATRWSDAGDCTTRTDAGSWQSSEGNVHLRSLDASQRDPDVPVHAVAVRRRSNATILLIPLDPMFFADRIVSDSELMDFYAWGQGRGAIGSVSKAQLMELPAGSQCK